MVKVAEGPQAHKPFALNLSLTLIELTSCALQWGTWLLR